MFKKERIKELENKLIKNNVELIENGENTILYRDDKKHLLVSLEYDEFAGGENPYDSWIKLWNISTSYSDVYTFDNVIDITEELINIADADYDYLNDHLYEKSFSFTKKYLERLGVIVIPLCFNNDNVVIDESDPLLMNVNTIAYATKQQLREYYDTKLVTKKVINNALDDLKNSLKTYSYYRKGEVYSLSVYDTLENECIDALCGIYFDDDFNNHVNDVFEYLNHSMMNKIDIDFGELKKQMHASDQSYNKAVYFPL